MAVKYLEPVRPRQAEGTLGRAYAQIRREFGVLADPFLLHSADPELLAGLWSLEREAVICGSVPRAAKEAVAATISQLNACPYCAEAHSIFTGAAGGSALARAVDRGDRAEIADQRTRALVGWAAATLSPGAGPIERPPFDRAEAPEVLGTALAYHYVNRPVNVLLSERLMPGGRGPLNRVARRAGALWLRRSARRRPQPGASLGLLPEAELPGDLGWAAGSAAVAGAVARFAAQAERAGIESLPPRVRELVADRVGAWEGEQPGLGRGWVEESLRELPEGERAAGRIALLTAFASYQVDSQVVAEFVGPARDDRRLLGAVAWSAFCAARRVTSWLAR